MKFQASCSALHGTQLTHREKYNERRITSKHDGSVGGATAHQPDSISGTERLEQRDDLENAKTRLAGSRPHLR